MTDVSIDDDGFTKVEPKFKYKSTPTNNKKHHKKKKNATIRYYDGTDWTLHDMIKQLDSYREKLMDSRFYTSLLPLLTDHLLPRQCVSMVCYGIGSMQESIAARYQFMLALAIRDLLKVEDISIYDPVMTSLDKQACAHYQLHVIPKDEQCKRSTTQPTLFYMPHCARLLYSNTLGANWTPTALNNVTLIGNDVSDVYVTSQPDAVLRRECPYLVPASTLIQTVPFPEFDINNVFNNLAIQHFPTLPAHDDAFWSSVPDDKASQDKTLEKDGSNHDMASQKDGNNQGDGKDSQKDDKTSQGKDDGES